MTPMILGLKGPSNTRRESHDSSTAGRKIGGLPLEMTDTLLDRSGQQVKSKYVTLDQAD